MPLSLSASMTRWKPSVSSCSVPDASVFFAVLSMPRLPERRVPGCDTFSFVARVNGSLAKWLLAMRLHIGGEAEGVVARTFLCEFRVARLQRFDDSEMLGQGGRRTFSSSDGELAVAAHVQQKIVGQIDQHRRLGERDQRLVEGDIGSGIFLDMILRQPVLAEILEEIT